MVFNVSCPGCILTNCISQVKDHTCVLVLEQQVLSVQGNDPWSIDNGLQVIAEIKKALSRQNALLD